MESYEYELAQRRIEELRSASDKLRVRKNWRRTARDQAEEARLSAQLRLFFLQLGRGEAR